MLLESYAGRLEAVNPMSVASTKRAKNCPVPGNRPTPATSSLTGGGGGISADHVELADIELVGKNREYLRRIMMHIMHTMHITMHIIIHTLMHATAMHAILHYHCYYYCCYALLLRICLMLCLVLCL